MRNTVAIMLARRGAEVVEADDGPSALGRIAQSGTSSFDLLVTDISMPRMDGPELFARLEQQIPALRVIFMSGYAREAVMQKFPLPAGCGYLVKPFTPSALIQTAQALLAGEPV